MTPKTNTPSHGSTTAMGFCLQNGMVLAAVSQGSKLTDLFVEQEIPTGAGTVGNIYKGRVIQVVPTLQACFVDIGLLKHGFLSMSDVSYEAVERSRKGKQGKKNVEDLFRPGDPVIVQIEKAARGDKGVTLTTKISLPGRYAVYMPYGRDVYVSRQIQSGAERDRLRKLLRETQWPMGGIILRTAAENKGKSELEEDIAYLIRTWRTIQREYDQTEGIRLLHQELGIVERTLRDHYHRGIRQIYYTEPWMGANAKHFLSIIAPRRTVGRMLRQVNARGIWSQLEVRKEIEQLFHKRVHLPCGGTMIIEEMETLTAIDVNTGKNIAGTTHEETILMTNMEAAEEIPRQLRLRQIGGIVVIDFIDMRLKKDRDRVLNTLNRNLERDRTPSDVLDFTEIGLVQITRQRTGRSLSMQLSEECPHCRGNGRVPTLTIE